MADSKKLIANVAKLPAPARQHPTVQADLAQAQRVVAEGTASGGRNAQGRPDGGQPKEQGGISRAALSLHASPSARAASGSAKGITKVQSRWKRSTALEGSSDRVVADRWHNLLRSMRNTGNPVAVEEAISWRPAMPIPPDLERKIFTATQTFLDMLPRDLVKRLGPMKLSIKPSIEEDADGEYDYVTDTLTLSHAHVQSCTQPQLRSLLWHELGHWLYYSSRLNPGASPELKAWRDAIDNHWAARTGEEPSFKHIEGWEYVRDGLISDYAGRRYPGQNGGVELPSVYLAEAAWGPDNLAKWCRLFPSEIETFMLALSIFNK